MKPREVRQHLAAQVGDGQQVVAGDMEALSTQRNRAVDNILARTVVIIRHIIFHRAAVIAQGDEVKIGRGEDPHRVAQVARNRQCLEKHLGANHRRAKIAEDASFQVAYRSGKDLKILPAGPTEGSKIYRRMLVNDIRAQGDMNGIGDAQAVGGIEQAVLAVWKTLILSDQAAQGFAHTQPIARAGCGWRRSSASRSPRPCQTSHSPDWRRHPRW